VLECLIKGAEDLWKCGHKEEKVSVGGETAMRCTEKRLIVLDMLHHIHRDDRVRTPVWNALVQITVDYSHARRICKAVPEQWEIVICRLDQEELGFGGFTQHTVCEGADPGADLHYSPIEAMSEVVEYPPIIILSFGKRIQLRAGVCESRHAWLSEVWG
jgi:hypothetical protein